MRIAILVVSAGTAAMCWLAVSMVFWENDHHLTERSIDERLSGVLERMNSNAGQYSDDGSQNLGFFLVGRKFENRIILPEDWDGEFGPVELPGEIPHFPTEFLSYVQLLMCGNVERVTEYVEEEISITTIFYEFDGRLAAQVRADSSSC